MVGTNLSSKLGSPVGQKCVCVRVHYSVCDHYSQITVKVGSPVGRINI